MKKREIFIRRYTWKSISNDVKKLLKYIKQKLVYKVNSKTYLPNKVITAKEIQCDHCQLALLGRSWRYIKQ